MFVSVSVVVVKLKKFDSLTKLKVHSFVDGWSIYYNKFCPARPLVVLVLVIFATWFRELFVIFISIEHCVYY
jgi:hypothetical protein